MREETSLVGYCGLYCGACAIHQGRIKGDAESLLKVLGAYSFREIAKEVAGYAPEFEHYPQFEKVLHGLMKMFGECPGCIAGGGPPVCQIRDCCRERGFQTCGECEEMPCDLLKPQVEAYRGHLEELREIRKIGVDKWAIEQARRVKAGFSYLEVMK